MVGANDPLTCVLAGLPRITPDEERAAAVRARCARHYAARQQPPDRRQRRGGTIALAVLSTAYLVEIARVVVMLYAAS